MACIILYTDSNGLPEGPHQAQIAETIALENLGLEQVTPRSIGSIEIIGAGWNICNSWSGMAATLAIGITQGGTVTVLHGLFVILFMVGGSAATLGELASVYPTAGGQYHWTSILSPKSTSRGLVWLSQARIPVLMRLIYYRATYADPSTSWDGLPALPVFVSFLHSRLWQWCSSSTPISVLNLGITFSFTRPSISYFC